MTKQILISDFNYFVIPGIPIIKPDALRILKVVCKYFGVQDKLLKGKTRKREVVEARQIAMYFIRLKTRYSLAEVGGIFGGRDHTTTIYSVSTVRDLMYTDPVYKNQVDKIEQLLYA